MLWLNSGLDAWARPFRSVYVLQILASAPGFLAFALAQIKHIRVVPARRTPAIVLCCRIPPYSVYAVVI